MNPQQQALNAIEEALSLKGRDEHGPAAHTVPVAVLPTAVENFIKQVRSNTDATHHRMLSKADDMRKIALQLEEDARWLAEATDHLTQRLSMLVRFQAQFTERVNSYRLVVPIKAEPKEKDVAPHHISPPVK